jgi:Cytochrome c3
MTLRIRTITQRTGGGGDIVRESVLEKDSALVGRGNDCDLQIGDLAVMLNHARVSRTGDRVTIEAVGGTDLEVDGKFTRSVGFKASETHKLTLGGHRLTIAPADDGTTSLTLERVAALSDAADIKDEKRVFSSLEGGSKFGRRRWAWAAVATVLLLFLAWPVIGSLTTPPPAPKDKSSGAFHDASWSSGPLSKAHAGLENDCKACHVAPFVSVQDVTCKTCHAKVHDHAPVARLLRASFEEGVTGTAKAALAHTFNLPQGRCTECHKEHNGPQGADSVGGGDCIQCHVALKAKLPDTKLLNAADFKDAHPQFRPEVVMQPSFDAPLVRRVSLDAKPVENSGLIFPHDVHLMPKNGVARMQGRQMACADCHRPGPGNVSFLEIEMERDCGDCHSLAFSTTGGVTRTLRHGEPQQVVADLLDFYRQNGTAAPVPDRRRPGAALSLGASASPAAKVRAVFQEGGACYDCHKVIAPANPASLAFKIAPVSLTQRYMKLGWFAHGDHDTADMPCASCHAAKTSKVSADLLLPGIARCRDCHVGAHPEKGKVTSDCGACHSFHPGSTLASQKTASKNPAITGTKLNL